MKKIFKFWPLVIAPIVLGILSFVVPFTYWPEMLNWPFFLGQGWQPYRDFAIIHTPILPYFLLASYQVFGFIPQSLHLFGTLLLVLTDFFLVLLIFRLTKKTNISIIGGLFFCLLALAFNGNHVWFESLLAPILLGVFYYQLSFYTLQVKSKLVLAGFLMGLALLTKQTAIYLLPSFLIFLYFLKKKKKFSIGDLINVFLLFSLPIILTLVVFLLYLMAAGNLPNFFEWGVKFVFLKPFITHAQNSYVLLPNPRQIAILLPFFALPVIIAFFRRNFETVFSFAFLVCLAFLSYPRFDYFHLVPSMLFLSVLMGLSFSKISMRSFMVIMGLFILFSVAIFKKNLDYTHTFIENKYLDVARVVSQNYQNRSLFILNDPEQIYFLTQKLPAVKPWVPQLPWYLEYYGHNFYEDFAKLPPDIIISQPYLKTAVDGLGAYQPKEVVEYISTHYTLVKEFDSQIRILKKND